MKYLKWFKCLMWSIACLWALFDKYQILFVNREKVFWSLTSVLFFLSFSMTTIKLISFHKRYKHHNHKQQQKNHFKCPRKATIKAAMSRFMVLVNARLVRASIYIVLVHHVGCTVYCLFHFTLPILVTDFYTHCISWAINLILEIVCTPKYWVDLSCQVKEAHFDLFFFLVLMQNRKYLQ